MAWKPITYVLAFILIASAIAIVILASHQVYSGGVQPKYKFSDSQIGTIDDNTYGVLAADDNGTAYISEVLATWIPPAQRAYLVALDKNGDEQWRVGTNSELNKVTIGEDGNLYVVDLMNATDWDAENWNYNNLTAYDSHGKMLWNYTSSQGVLGICGVFKDGTVVVQRSSRSDHYLQGIINGTVAWSKPYDENNEYSWACTALSFKMLNGTLDALCWVNGTNTVVHALDAKGVVVWSIDLGDGLYTFSAVHADVLYDMTEEKVDASTTIASIVAVNITEGKVAWKTVLGDRNVTGWLATSSVGSYQGGSVYVDGKGIVYTCWNGTLYALGHNGELLWKKATLLEPNSAFSTGGVLIGNDTLLKRIDGQGNTVWQYDMAKPMANDTILVQKDIVYLSEGNVMMALAQYTISADISLIIVILSFDALAIVSYVVWHKPVKT